MPCRNPIFGGVVLVDTREQLAYRFAGIKADKAEGGGRMSVRTRRQKIDAGDYSLCGFADRVAVERKSKDDLFGTLGKGRGRFERELSRLNLLDYAAVVVEADWAEVVNDPPSRSQITPKNVFRSVVSWQQRFPWVHWWFVPGRGMAEATTFRILDRFHREHTGGL
jgi:DNA excision repair protein ERCC-4